MMVGLKWTSAMLDRIQKKPPALQCKTCNGVRVTLQSMLSPADLLLPTVVYLDKEDFSWQPYGGGASGC